MSPEDEEKRLKRRRQTLYFLGAGSVSLLLPLVGVAYLRLKDAPSSASPSNSPESIFDRRDGEAPQYVKASLVPPPAASGRMVQKPSTAGRSSSLGFVNTGGEYYQEKPSPPPPAPTTLPAAQEEPAQSKEKSPPPAKSPPAAKKPVNYPRLKSTGSSSFTPNGFSEKKLGLGSKPE